MMIGHGSTYPSERFIKDMHTDLPGLQRQIVGGFASGKSKQTLLYVCNTNSSMQVNYRTRQYKK